VKDRTVVRHEIELLKVWSDRLAPHPGVASRVAHYRCVVADQIGEPFGRATQRITRRYHRESVVVTRNLIRIAESPDGVAVASAADGSRNSESAVVADPSGNVGPMQ
jgi:hypothetical protein